MASQNDFDIVILVDIRLLCFMQFSFLKYEDRWYTGLFLICVPTVQQTLNLSALLASETLVKSAFEKIRTFCVHRLHVHSQINSEEVLKRIDWPYISDVDILFRILHWKLNISVLEQQSKLLTLQGKRARVPCFSWYSKNEHRTFK